MTTEEKIVKQELPKLRIRSAKDIFEALVSDDFGVRVSIAQAIAANTDKAASYGPYNGMELIDYLLQLLGQNTDSSYRPVLLAALGAFSDPRIPDVFMSEMERSGDPESVMAAASRLAAEKGDRVRQFMARMTRRSATTTQARMAANIMAHYEDLLPEERVRIAVIADVSFDAPSLDDETERAWLRELAGDSAEQARLLFEGFGSDAFLRLRGKWLSLDDNSRAWLLRWGARDHQLYSIELLVEALKYGSKALVLEALIAVSGMGSAAALFRLGLIRFLDDDDRAIRIAAIKAGVPLTGIRERIFAEQDVELRLALIARLSGEEGALQTLLDLLADNRWEIRAAATRALKLLGKPAVDAVKPFLTHSDVNVRASAAQVLGAISADAV